MIKQFWKVTIEDATFDVGYECFPIIGKTILSVNGDKFTVRNKPFGIGLERSEPIILGMNQGMLSISKKGVARLVVKDGEVCSN